MAEPNPSAPDVVRGSHLLVIAGIAALTFVLLRFVETRLSRRAPAGAPTP